jgi:predicted nucleic acid-binding protein
MSVVEALAGDLLALDTDILTDWRYGEPAVVTAIDAYIVRHAAPPALVAFSVFEARRGFEMEIAARGENERLVRDRTNLEELVAGCDILPFDDAAASIAAYVFGRAATKQRAKQLGDILIAATALAHGRGIATRNIRDFREIGGLLPPQALLRIAEWKQTA